jgi:hypothetical protein
VESTCRYHQHQLIVNLNARLNKNVSFTSSYVLNRALSDTDGVGTFPGKPYSFIGEYGPAATDVRQRFSLTGNVSLKGNVRLSPFLTADSGPPFDITVGRDLYGTTLFNARPGLPTDPTKPGLIRTRYGLLDPNPTADQQILPRNYGRGPGQVMLNLRVAKVIDFGGERATGAAAPQRGSSGDGRPAPGVFNTGGGQPGGAAASRRYSLYSQSAQSQ